MNHQNKYPSNFIMAFTLMIFIGVVVPTRIHATNFIPNTAFSNDMFLNMSNEIDSRIAGTIASEATKSLWTTRGDSAGGWVRNPDVWTSNGIDIDWTGTSPWNSTGGYTRAGALISPRHLVFANHYQIGIGATVVFVTSDNQIVTKTLTNMTSIPNTDIAIGILNSSVPESVAYYPVFSTTTWEQYLDDNDSEGAYDLPIAALDQDDHAIVKIISKNELYQNVETRIFHQLASNGKRLEFGESIIGGDSGNPAFAIVGGIPVLLLTHHTPTSGPSYSHYFTEVNNAMDQLSGTDEYNLSSISLANFNAPLVIPESQNFTVPASSTIGVAVGTLNITYNIENDPIYAEIISGNPDGALAIDQTTGVVTAASSTVVSPNGFFRTIGLKISENDQNGRATFATTTISSRALPSFAQSSYSFYIDENAVASTTVGTTAFMYTYPGNFTYSILSGNTDAAFGIDSDNGVLRVNNSSALVFANNPIFNLTVRGTENNTTEHLSFDVPVTIHLNDLSVRFSSSTYSIVLLENASNGHIVSSVSIDNGTISGGAYYSIISGNEDGVFSINNTTGGVTVLNSTSLNYDAKNTYILNLGVSSTNATSTVLATTSLVVSITNVVGFPVTVVTSTSGGGGSSSSGSEGGIPALIPPVEVKNTNTENAKATTNIISSIHTNVSKIIRDFGIGGKGNDVKNLQKFLNEQGFVVVPKKGQPGSLGNETLVFGPATKQALIKFQIKNKILPATGYFGPKTKAFIRVLVAQKKT